MARPIYVTRPSLPPLSDFIPLLEEIWDSHILSNRGPFHQKLEQELAGWAGGAQVSLTANGMLGLEAVIAAARLNGEVVTTAYSFVATSHAIARAGLTPVFADIEAGGFNIDPAAVEEAITERTSAILAVHCYGYPCQHDRLAEIARRRGLTLIYDAAHAFGVTKGGEQVLGWGDYAAVSFHATKAFNTFEGGMALCHDQAGKAATDLWLNFGIASETSIPAVGTNGKMSEFNAAFGLLQLSRFAIVREQRASVDRRYRQGLDGVSGIRIPQVPEGVGPNFSYFPILIGPEFALDRDGLYDALKADSIFSRRYFFPLLSALDPYSSHPSSRSANLPHATEAADRILCLPIYPDLSADDQDRVIEAVIRHGRP